jgi:hypothetical protein
MPTDPLALAGFAVGVIFLLGMLVGVVLMVASAIVRRRGSAVAARLLMSGPPGVLVAAALYVLSLDFLPAVFRFVMISLYVVTAIPVFAWVLRAWISFAPIGRPRN